ncbi:hypothetical protein, partial [Pseudomonas sp.]|uniref:hypothetical protein n=2 Tax=Pseudomonas sp. TaxID=306 RepID=UPI003A95B561
HKLTDTPHSRTSPLPHWIFITGRPAAICQLAIGFLLPVVAYTHIVTKLFSASLVPELQQQGRLRPGITNKIAKMSA